MRGAWHELSEESVDAGEVAARLVELALGTPAGLARHIAGHKA